MTQTRLRQTLDSIVREYGFEQVSQSLRGCVRRSIRLGSTFGA